MREENKEAKNGGNKEDISNQDSSKTPQKAKSLWSWFLPVIILVVVAMECVFVAKEVGSTQKKLNALKESTQSTSEDKITKDRLEETTKTTDKEKAKTLTLTFVGDIMCYGAQLEEAYDENTDTYDFSRAFDNVKPYLENSDLTIGNLETVLGGKEIGYKGYPLFNTPISFAESLKEVGFDVFTTANNHAFDQGAIGVQETLDALDEIGISAVGSYRTEEDKNKILIKKVNGWKIAFVSFTYGQNAESSEARQYFNYLTEEDIKSQMELAREQEPDFIVAMPHWGEEFYTTVNDRQRYFADLLIEEGADLIIGSHPHVLQTMKKKDVKDKEGKTKHVFIAYSMGNFFTNQSEEYSLDQVILTLTVKKGKNGIIISNIENRAAYMAKPGEFDTIDHYQVLDISSYKTRFKEEQEGTDEVLYHTLLESEQHVNTLLKGN